MAQLLVRNLDDALKERLRVVAASHGRSMEEEARVILHTALTAEVAPSPDRPHIGVAERIHALFMDVDVPPEFFDALDEVRQGSATIDVTPRGVDFSSPDFDR